MYMDAGLEYQMSTYVSWLWCCQQILVVLSMHTCSSGATKCLATVCGDSGSDGADDGSDGCHDGVVKSDVNSGD